MHTMAALFIKDEMKDYYNYAVLLEMTVEEVNKTYKLANYHPGILGTNIDRTYLIND